MLFQIWCLFSVKKKKSLCSFGTFVSILMLERSLHLYEKEQFLSTIHHNSSNVLKNSEE